jgi:Na+/H+ antiporter NhaD/arsenite permease-like protein
VGALQQYSPAKLAAGAVAVEDIRIAYLLGNITLNKFIVAISVAAVFFGAATYIGNGPNFMVKAIAEHQNVHTPGFMGYLAKYTLLFLLPMIVVVWWIFFRQ